jgi:hypothetical protein
MHEFTRTGPLDETRLQKVREPLIRTSQAELVKFYNAGLHMCQLNLDTAFSGIHSAACAGTEGVSQTRSQGERWALND